MVEEVLTWWRMGQIATSSVGTPCFVISQDELERQYSALRSLGAAVSVRHLLSFKTQPVPMLARWARTRGLGVDVVSEFELHAALAAGFRPEQIVVNGAGKSSWLRKVVLANLTVHIDSLHELTELAQAACDRRWRIGLRLSLKGVSGNKHDSDQFGMTLGEFLKAKDLLNAKGVPIDGVHFHIHAETSSVAAYVAASTQLAEAVAQCGLCPSYVDIGGGLPIPGENAIPVDHSTGPFNMIEFADFLRSVPSKFPTAREIWLENGRYLSGTSGSLVVTILDKKTRGDVNYLICDGGRVNHARVASIQTNDLLVKHTKSDKRVRTIVCGPTCGSVDRLGEWNLPSTLAIGDQLIWRNAGAYHLPLETRFSFGLAPVVWFTGMEHTVIRRRETTDDWSAGWCA